MKILIKKILSIKLVFLILFAQFNKINCFDYEFINENKKTIIASVAGVALVIALLLAYMKESDKDLVKNSTKLCNKMPNFENSIKTLETQIGQGICDKQQLEFERRRIIDSFDERILDYLIANGIKHHGINEYISNLEALIKDLKYYKKKLSRRLNKNSNEYHNEMKELHKQMDNMTPRLKFLLDYTKNHTPYFELYLHGEKLANIYQNEWKILNSNYYNEYSLVKELQKSAQLKFSDSAYPYTNYAKYLENHIKEIDDLVRKTKYQYPLKTKADPFKNSLQKIRNLIVSSDEYLNEKRKYEEEKNKKEFEKAKLDLEKQKLEIEKERNEIEREKAKAKEREATAKEMQTIAKIFEPDKNKINVNIKL